MFVRLIAISMILTSQHVMASDFLIWITEYLDDQQIFAALNESDIDETFSWEPESGSRPLTIVGALNAVRKEIAVDGGGPAPELVEIELK
jgi:hypothetical protein